MSVPTTDTVLWHFVRIQDPSLLPQGSSGALEVFTRKKAHNNPDLSSLRHVINLYVKLKFMLLIRMLPIYAYEHVTLTQQLIVPIFRNMEHLFYFEQPSDLFRKQMTSI